MTSFSRLIRFLAKDGNVYYGDAILPPGVTDIGKAVQAKILNGNPLGKHELTEQVVDVDSLLSPLAREQVRTVRCLGLNYEQHAHETGTPIPQYPILFFRPNTSLNGPFETVPIPTVARQFDGVDYECELERTSRIQRLRHTSQSTSFTAKSPKNHIFILVLINPSVLPHASVLLETMMCCSGMFKCEMRALGPCLPYIHLGSNREREAVDKSYPGLI